MKIKLHAMAPLTRLPAPAQSFISGKGKYSPLRISLVALAGTVAASLCTAILLGQIPAAATDTLTVVLSGRTPALMNALNLVAEGAGFYRDERLTVSQLSVNGALEAVRTCSAGKGDICPIGIEPLITNYADGIRLKMFLSRARTFAYVIAVPEDSPIRQLSDLKGKTIGVHVLGAGASGVFTTASALSAAGLKPTDYKLTAIGYENEAADALASGKVDAAAFPYYEFIPFLVSGRKLRIFHHPAFEDMPNTGYAAAPSIIAAKGDGLKRFSRAIVKASLFIHYNAAVAARLLLAADGAPFTDADVQRKTAELSAWQKDLPAGDPESRRIGALPTSGVQDYIQLLRDAGVAKAAVPASEVVTNEFIDFANDFDRRALEKLAKSMDRQGR
jgi:NitT/TauT family transport system substrate-binding protein